MGYKINKPCTESWDQMASGSDSTKRHCASCEKDVVDLRRVTRKQALTILQNAQGSVCARVRSTPSGHAVFAPEPRRLPFASAALVGLSVACGGTAHSEETTPSAPIAQAQRNVNATRVATTEAVEQMPVATTSSTTVENQPHQVQELMGEMVYDPNSP